MQARIRLTASTGRVRLAARPGIGRSPVVVPRRSRSLTETPPTTSGSPRPIPAARAEAQTRRSPHYPLRTTTEMAPWSPQNRRRSYPGARSRSRPSRVAVVKSHAAPQRQAPSITQWGVVLVSARPRYSRHSTVKAQRVPPPASSQPNHYRGRRCWKAKVASSPPEPPPRRLRSTARKKGHPWAAPRS